MCENNSQIINVMLNINNYEKHFFLKLNFNFTQEFVVKIYKQTTLFSINIFYYTDILTF